MKKIARRVQQVKRSIFDADRIVVYHGDCLKVMASIPEASVDTIVTDPPYGLEFMGKEWDHGIPGVPFWSTALRVVKPGAALLAFGGTRTFHRLTCAIEDAGWEIKDCLMWVYGSGFPKSLDVSKAIDEKKGAKRKKRPGGKGPTYQRRIGNTRPWMSDPDHQIDSNEPATPEAARWQGWGTALKPAWEPIILARKPLDGTVAECALRHGTGALNVDGCRIDAEPQLAKNWQRNQSQSAKDGKVAMHGGLDTIDLRSYTPQGRWPANVVFQHDARCVLVGMEPSPGYTINRFKDGAKPFGGGAGHEYESERVPDGEREVWACVPGCPVRTLDEQSGQCKDGTAVMRRVRGKPTTGFIGKHADNAKDQTYGGTGGASRFFYTAKASTTERVLGCPPGYENRHPTVKPLDLCRWLCRLTKTPDGGVVLDPFSGSGSIAVAALLEGRRAIAIELEEESANATVTRVQAALKYGDGLQKLKQYKLEGRKKLKRRRRCEE